MKKIKSVWHQNCATRFSVAYKIQNLKSNLER